MDFLSYPPEVNSARMYAGPGAGPMLAAAQAWQALGAELHSAADSYQAVVTELTSSSWLGPSSVAMKAAAFSYLTWLRGTALRADESGAQAQSAAAAYQTAFAETVPPPLVAANRARLAALIATNVMGKNAQAIAATEAQYAEMWAQDAAAMFGYASASASAAMLTPFESPPQTTNPATSADSAGGVAESVGRAAAQRVAAAAAELPSAAAGEELEFLVVLADLLTVFLAVPAFYSLFIAVPANVVGLVGFPVSVYGLGAGLHTDEIISGWEGIEPFPSTESAPVKPFPAPLLNLPAGTIPPSSVVAGRGDSSVVGELSVPPTWTVATEAVEPVAYTLPGTAANADAVPAAGPDSGGTLSEMALAGMAGRVMADAVGSGAGRAARGTRAALIGTRPVSVTDARGDSGEAVPRGPARAVVTGVASELREFAKLRDEGLLTDDEYAVQRRRLLGG